MYMKRLPERERERERRDRERETEERNERATKVRSAIQLLELMHPLRCMPFGSLSREYTKETKTQSVGKWRERAGQDGLGENEKEQGESAHKRAGIFFI